MRYVGLIDVETTGVDPEKDVCIEVAVQVYDIRLACGVVSYAELIRHHENPAEEVNGIPSQALAEASPADKIWHRFSGITQGIECCVAHNAAFDSRFCLDLCKPWVCTMNDFKWPGARSSKSLAALALSLGLGVVSAHRAMTDVDTMSRIFSRVAEMGHSLEEMFAHALRPKKRFVAIVSYEDRQIAKESGFSWDGKKKVWWRDMALEDVAGLPFKVREV